MKKICTLVSLMLMMLGGNALAADNSGLYYLDEVTLDGTDWYDGMEIVTGQTYTVNIEMHYDQAYTLFDQSYASNQDVVIEINGVEVWNETAVAHSISTSSVYNLLTGNYETQYDYAEWSFSGLMSYADPIDPEGESFAYIARNGADWQEYGSDGLEPRKQDAGYKVNLVNPVPEPSTLFLLGAGLFGIGAVRRRKT